MTPNDLAREHWPYARDLTRKLAGRGDAAVGEPDAAANAALYESVRGYDGGRTPAFRKRLNFYIQRRLADARKTYPNSVRFVQADPEALAAAAAPEPADPDAAESFGAITKALEAVDRRILWAVFWEGKTLKEAGEAEGMSINWTFNRLHRALDRLRGDLERAWPPHRER